MRATIRLSGLASAVISALALPAAVQAQNTGSKDDGGLGLGPGVAVFLLDEPHIEATMLTNDRIVVVTKEVRHRVSLWAQAHYTLTNWCWWNKKIARKDLNLEKGKCPTVPSIVPGIFFGLGQGANGDFGSTFGGGLMLVLVKPRPGTSLNLGVGYYRTLTRRLADGIEAGKPLPEGFNDVQFKERSVGGLMLNFSVGFQ